MKFTSKISIELSKNIISRVNQDGSVIVMKMDDSDLIYKINGVAAEIWQQLQSGKNNLGEVAEDLAIQYNVEPEKIIEDSQTFLTKAEELNFIICT